MLQTIEFLAVISGGIYGVLLARRKGLDFVGVFCVAFITALGGGTLRDILLDRRPLFWLRTTHFPLIIFGLAVAASVTRRWVRWPASAERWLYVPDALGLGLFSIVGVNYALEANTTWFAATLFGVITGSFGGVIGDVVCNELPNLFRSGSPLYATCSFVGCWAYLLLRFAGVPQDVALWGGIALIVGMRLLAVKYDLRLPD
jgi:uncharacterized membrane protein YeiH